MRERDSQRSRVYRAENKAFSSQPEASTWLETTADIERYLRYVVSLKRVTDSWPVLKQPVAVHDGRGLTRASANQWSITMPNIYRKKWIVLHELSHVIHQRQVSTCRSAFHGWQYAEIYLRLVLLVLGREAHDALKASFKAHGVKYKEPAKRQPLSPERRAQLVLQLQAARAARAAIPA